jgi:outer membrane protein assembly factor BamD
MITPKQQRRTLGIRASSLAAVAATLLGACANRDAAVLAIGDQQLYEEGAEHLRNGNFAGAILSFQNLTVQYQFSPWTRQAQLDLIYAFYRSGQPESALDVAETFIRENPRLPEVAYALYMIGVIRFDSDPNFLERMFRVDVTERPPRDSQLSFDAFEELIRRFPESAYVEDARQRMIFLRNRLATYENHIARYYLDRGAYVAAINRAKYAVEHYPGAPQLEESLALMVEAYDALGATDLARDTERVLQENFGELAVPLPAVPAAPAPQPEAAVSSPSGAFAVSSPR